MFRLSCCKLEVERKPVGTHARTDAQVEDNVPPWSAEYEARRHRKKQVCVQPRPSADTDMT